MKKEVKKYQERVKIMNKCIVKKDKLLKKLIGKNF